MKYDFVKVQWGSPSEERLTNHSKFEASSQASSSLLGKRASEENTRDDEGEVESADGSRESTYNASSNSYSDTNIASLLSFSQSGSTPSNERTESRLRDDSVSPRDDVYDAIETFSVSKSENSLGNIAPSGKTENSLESVLPDKEAGHPEGEGDPTTERMENADLKVEFGYPSFDKEADQPTTEKATQERAEDVIEVEETVKDEESMKSLPNEGPRAGSSNLEADKHVEEKAEVTVESSVRSDNVSTVEEKNFNDNGGIVTDFSLLSLESQTQRSLEFNTIGSFLFQLSFPSKQETEEDAKSEGKSFNEAHSAEGEQRTNSNIEDEGRESPEEGRESPDEVTNEFDSGPLLSQEGSQQAEEKLDESASKLDSDTIDSDFHPGNKEFEGILRDLESVCGKQQHRIAMSNPGSDHINKHPPSQGHEVPNVTQVSEELKTKEDQMLVEQSVVRTETVTPAQSTSQKKKGGRRKFRIKRLFCALGPCSNKTVLKAVEEEKDNEKVESTVNVVDSPGKAELAVEEGSLKKSSMEESVHQTNSESQGGVLFSPSNQVEPVLICHSLASASSAPRQAVEPAPTEEPSTVSIASELGAEKVLEVDSKYESTSIKQSSQDDIATRNDVGDLPVAGPSEGGSTISTPTESVPSFEPMRTLRGKDPVGGFQMANAQDHMAAFSQQSYTESNGGKYGSWLSSPSAASRGTASYTQEGTASYTQEGTASYTQGSASYTQEGTASYTQDGTATYTQGSTIASESEVSSQYTFDTRTDNGENPSVDQCNSYMSVKEAVSYNLYDDARLFVKSLGFSQEAIEQKKGNERKSWNAESALVNPVSSMFGELADILEFKFPSTPGRT